ncbi:MAG: spermidine synthase [Desulfobacterales bacterium RIFOXYA12_FULL_46_15]|nr:MAG: spermidine synthase [Desulfobacula sp. GWF2_41_7]OGR27787.1 MAG: spermidine synthase [Desulfobacterales bacterium RIFOXYA12_FULL_46_15]
MTIEQLTPDKIINGWFSETSDMWPGIAVSIEIEKTLFSRKSIFQQIDLFETKHHGRMLVLDGIIQLTDFDEFAYQEMLAHIPMFAHPLPEKVLVVGGGDGGIIREVAKHDTVLSIDICEIDERVIQVSKEFLPGMSTGFNDPRVTVHIADGSEFVQHHPATYDVIIVDSSDPVGPGEILFEKIFYSYGKRALRDNGLLAVQAESFFLHPDKVEKIVKNMKDLFVHHGYAYSLIPTFTGGHVGICLGSDGYDPSRPSRAVSKQFQAGLRYYNPEIHKASFVLPRFAEKLIREA